MTKQLKSYYLSSNIHLLCLRTYYCIFDGKNNEHRPIYTIDITIINIYLQILPKCAKNTSSHGVISEGGEFDGETD